ncbi:DNA glycosylase superfamily protein [Tasmannia lanceolata]|uniref:DNA glycosylase superfamily protein n=1 Tax=Tasmannia lanceolata TaxID=3420 RepID=UPI0040628350
MCTTKAKTSHGVNLTPVFVAQIDGRPVLQPACNRVISTVEPHQTLKKKFLVKSPPPLPTTTTITTKASLASHKLSPPISPKLKPPTPGVKRGNDPNGLNSSVDKPLTPKSTQKSASLLRKKSKNSSVAPPSHEPLSNFSVSVPSPSLEEPGSIAAARREQVTLLQAQRKMRIAHYGRTAKKLEGKAVLIDSSTISTTTTTTTTNLEEKRCSFITPNSDPIYVAYHDEEWGVPVHDDKMLFELLVLSGAQVGLDWTSILKKRQDFRTAFAGFDIEIVANFSERQIASISAEYSMDLSRVRGAVDNANRILQIRREFDSFDKYLWGFVNQKPITTQYRSCRNIPVKTSKSESISKDMVRRGFRLVGPTVLHSFMQAAGLTNDHLLTCPRHLQCTAPASAHHPIAAPAV